MPETATIHSEQRMPVQVAGGTMQEMIVVTYSTPSVAPRQVYIDPDHDTPQERMTKITADLKAFREQKPATLNLP